MGGSCQKACTTLSQCLNGCGCGLGACAGKPKVAQVFEKPLPGLGGWHAGAQEVWMWESASSTVVHRYDQNLKPLGTFDSGVNITGFAGDVGGTWYILTYNPGSWGQAVGYTGTQGAKAVWSMQGGDGGAGIAVDAKWVYVLSPGVTAYANQDVYLVDKKSGTIQGKVSFMKGAESTPLSQLVVLGGQAFTRRFGGALARFDLTAGPTAVEIDVTQPPVASSSVFVRVGERMCLGNNELPVVHCFDVGVACF